jgi:GT2 family glycosyltransferase
MNTNKLGLVTVLYKSDDVLEGFFKSLSLQDFKTYHLYIIDNSPSSITDQLIGELSVKYPIPGFTHIKNDNNVGVAKGNNQGIELALSNDSEFILLLNNDIEFYQKSLLDEMVKCAIETRENIIIPKIFYYNTRTIWMAGGKLLKNKAITTHVGFNEEDLPKYNNSAYYDYAPTCFMLISKKVFDTIGLMDEKYFVYYDDTDFITRAINKSFKIFYMPSLEVFHKVSSSTGGGESLFSIYYLNRNRFYFINKNLAFPNKQLSLIYSFVTRGLIYLGYRKNERKELIRAIKDGLNISTDN